MNDNSAQNNSNSGSGLRDETQKFVNQASKNVKVPPTSAPTPNANPANLNQNTPLVPKDDNQLKNNPILQKSSEPMAPIKPANVDIPATKTPPTTPFNSKPLNETNKVNPPKVETPPTLQGSPNVMNENSSPPSPSGNVSSMSQTAPVAPQTINPAKTDDTKGMDKTPPPSVTIETKKGGKGWGVFVLVSILAILAIYGGLAYLYFGNQKLKDNKSTASTQEVDNTENTEPLITPTPVFTIDQIKILNGNLVREIPNDQTITLVNKAETPSTGIIGFSTFTVSPDETRICLESLPPSPKPAVYIVNVDGSEFQEISAYKTGCIWTDDSTQILYTNTSSADNSTNIFLYDIATAAETNLTEASIPEGVIRNFSIVGFSSDSSKVICSYSDDLTPDDVKSCEVSLADITVNYLEQ